MSIVLGEVPDQWRAFFATAVFTGMRKGELCGLRKTDVDLVEKIITVRRSYARDTTKGEHADVIPVAPAQVRDHALQPPIFLLELPDPLQLGDTIPAKRFLQV